MIPQMNGTCKMFDHDQDNAFTTKDGNKNKRWIFNLTLIPASLGWPSDT